MTRMEELLSTLHNYSARPTAFSDNVPKLQFKSCILIKYRM